jgi:hypothetical protein
LLTAKLLLPMSGLEKADRSIEFRQCVCWSQSTFPKADRQIKEDLISRCSSAVNRHAKALIVVRNAGCRTVTPKATFEHLSVDFC